MPRHVACLVLAAGMLVAASQASAQKKVNVKLTHQAAFAHLIAGKHVIISPGAGECARPFASLLATDMMRAGIRVVPTEDLADVHVQLPVPPATTAHIQRRLGPSVLLAIDVLRCDARQREKMFGPGLPASHISRVDAVFQVQLRLIDLATGLETGSHTFRTDAQKQNESQTGIPEYPSPDDVKQIAVAKAVPQAQRLYVPWSETREILFIDDKECNLRQAFDFVKTGDYDAALRVSRENSASCTSNAKLSARASYNLGIAAMLKQQYEEALAAFDKAQSVNKRQVADLIQECQKEQALAVARRPAPIRPPVEEGPPSPTGIILTNDFIAKMIQGNVAEEEILEMIRNSPARFTTDSESVRKLKDAGASESILNAVLNKK